MERLGMYRKFATNRSIYTAVAKTLTMTNHFMTRPVMGADVQKQQRRLKQLRLPFELEPTRHR